MLRQNLFGHFTHQRQPDGQLVIALRSVERLERFALVNPDEVASLLLDVPELYMREHLERGAIAALQAAGTRGYAPHAARGTSQETNQAVGLTQREGLEDDGFRFARRHALSARRQWERLQLIPRQIARTCRTLLLTIRAAISQ